mmetsp:Transcript_22710/g.36777  ORF Transcript_22710/g.36777 Transcript_22710/m.36777 type:complete len:304 (+) Transcript_22710:1-912(+)
MAAATSPATAPPANLLTANRLPAFNGTAGIFGNANNNANWLSRLASSSSSPPFGSSNPFGSFDNRQLQPANIVTAQDLSQGGRPASQNGQATAKDTNDVDHDDECPICLDVLFDLQNPSSQLQNNVVCLKSCKHRFHQQCIMQSLQTHHDKCPSCRKPIGVEATGKGPSGSMSISLSPRGPCPGFPNSTGVITINYSLPSGIQASYMEQPGQRYSGTARVAYLPDNEEGRKLLARLRYAFRHGLTFRVGTSLTTGQSNTITWTSIHHKTSLYGGPHGFPDPNYIKNCNDSLDALHVPAAEGCL